MLGLSNVSTGEHLKEATQDSDSLCSSSGDKLLPGFKQATHCFQPPFHSQSRDGRGRIMPTCSRGIGRRYEVVSSRSGQMSLCLPQKEMARQPDDRGALRLYLGGSLGLPEAVCTLVSCLKGSVWSVMT